MKRTHEAHRLLGFHHLHTIIAGNLPGTVSKGSMYWTTILSDMKNICEIHAVK